ncbi:MAG: hypothetical protein Q4C75_07305 [Bergeyella zoohelcum]|nr:hypothetical protein [Bergeyella zoohelcum]
MGTVIVVIALIIIVGAIIGPLLFPEEKDSGDASKLGITVIFVFLMNLLPMAIVIAIAVFIVRSCS